MLEGDRIEGLLRPVQVNLDGLLLSHDLFLDCCGIALERLYGHIDGLGLPDLILNDADAVFRMLRLEAELLKRHLIASAYRLEGRQVMTVGCKTVQGCGDVGDDPLGLILLGLDLIDRIVTRFLNPLCGLSCLIAEVRYLFLDILKAPALLILSAERQDNYQRYNEKSDRQNINHHLHIYHCS